MDFAFLTCAQFYKWWECSEHLKYKKNLFSNSHEPNNHAVAINIGSVSLQPFVKWRPTVSTMVLLTEPRGWLGGCGCRWAVWLLLMFVSWIFVTCSLSLCASRHSVMWQTCMKTSEMDTTWSRCWRSSLGKLWWALSQGLILNASLEQHAWLSCASLTSTTTLASTGNPD